MIVVFRFLFGVFIALFAFAVCLLWVAYVVAFSLEIIRRVRREGWRALEIKSFGSFPQDVD